MSYSRWCDSRWFTYWDVSSGSAPEEQLFTVEMVAQFSYPQLKQDLEKCILLVRDKETDATPKELKELKALMTKFIRDVEREQRINNS